MKRPHGFRGMKGEKLKDLSQLKDKYPLFASPKLDGIRAFTFENEQKELFQDVHTQLVTLSLEEIPNRYIQKTIADIGIHGLDGELITYTGVEADKYNNWFFNGEEYPGINSKVMTENSVTGTAFKFHVFDRVSEECYLDRVNTIKACKELDNKFIVKWLPIFIQSEEELIEYENKCLLEGYEGVMLRSWDGPYKHGRSTIREGYMIKMKRFLDTEATVVGFEELMRNNNEPIVNKRGLIERSDEKEGKTAGGTLGSIICVTPGGVEFRIGSGLDDLTRLRVWQNQKDYLFKLVKYKYQPHGVKIAPRSPVFLGFRDNKDIS